MSRSIILASRSPRRIALLKQIGIECSVMPADIDENPLLGEHPCDYVQRLAIEKAKTIYETCRLALPEQLVLAADTTVAIHDEILGKPIDDAEAIAMLKKLSGATHLVHTAVAVCGYNRTLCMLNTTQVDMMPLTDEIIADYIASGEHQDKAGSYGIQGLAGTWIQRIEGSYTCVMGLPLYEAAQLLHQIKV